MIDEKALAAMTDKVLAHKPANIIPKSIGEGMINIGGGIPCAVLPGGVRVLSQRGAFGALKLSSGGGSVGENSGVHKLPRFLRPENLNPFISADLSERIAPVEYQPKAGGRTAFGIRAEVLPMICDVYLQALAAGALKQNQMAIAERCRILQKGFATIGIVALVDEATGYQDERAKRALAEILERFLTNEAREWTRTFPLDFYRQIYRLKAWDWQGLENGKKPPTPRLVGQYTDDLVYKRIAPKVLEVLKQRKKEREQKQLPAVRQHQWFNEERGHPQLREHIAGVMTLMRVSANWSDLMAKIDMALPRQTKQQHLFSRAPADGEQ